MLRAALIVVALAACGRDAPRAAPDLDALAAQLARGDDDWRVPRDR